MMHCPSRVTCTAPGITGSESSSRGGKESGLPCKRRPIRLLVGLTWYSCPKKESVSNQSDCKPSVIRSKFGFSFQANEVCRKRVGATPGKHVNSIPAVKGAKPERLPKMRGLWKPP